jgi:hypothetical protein
MSNEPAVAVQASKTAAFRRGVLTFLALAVLTIVELAVGTATGGSFALLYVIGLIKAALIVQSFMHVSSLWRGGSHG